MVNRIWQHHFGRGIVPTPNDFGKQGKPATHPELLDYLAAKFVSEGWSIKSMHRLIMLSRTYQLSSGRNESDGEKDASNVLLSSYPRRRLDAESIRDTLLMLGESLDLSAPEDHPFPPQKDWKFTQHNPFKAVYESKHRSVYLMTQRIQRHPFLSIFDGADPSVSTPVRGGSTTPLQALFLLNDPLVHEQAERFAARIEREGDNDASRIDAGLLARLSRLANCRRNNSGRGIFAKRSVRQLPRKAKRRTRLNKKHGERLREWFFDSTSFVTWTNAMMTPQVHSRPAAAKSGGRFAADAGHCFAAFSRFEAMAIRWRRRKGIFPPKQSE